MAISKVTYAGNTLIDLTGDTVAPENLLSGTTAHAANGEEITGIVEDKKGELEAQIADLRNQISSLKSDLAEVIEGEAWNLKGSFSGNNTLNISDIIDSKEILIIAFMTPPNAYITKASFHGRGIDFKENYDFELCIGGYFGQTYGIGILIKYMGNTKSLVLQDVYYNTRLSFTNVVVYVYYR